MATNSVPIINPDLSIDWLRSHATGEGVRVAVIDSGVDVSHPDLADKVVHSCVIEKKNNSIVTEEVSVDQSRDSYGHGTGVAGVISSIAPGVKITNVKVLGNYNSCSGDVLIEGIRWALSQDIKLINMSLATAKIKWQKSLNTVCEQAYLQDAILVISRRNNGPIGFPAMFSSVISVEIGDCPEPFATRYKSANFVECDAFGERVKVPATGGGYVERTGNSFAAPHITGVIALMLEKWPDLLAAEAKALLRAFSVDACH